MRCRQVGSLKTELTGDREAMTALRDLVATITVFPDYQIEIQGRLAALIDAKAFPNFSGGQVVAEEGLEPPTPGL